MLLGAEVLSRKRRNFAAHNQMLSYSSIPPSLRRNRWRWWRAMVSGRAVRPARKLGVYGMHQSFRGFRLRTTVRVRRATLIMARLPSHLHRHRGRGGHSFRSRPRASTMCCFGVDRYIIRSTFRSFPRQRSIRCGGRTRWCDVRLSDGTVTEQCHSRTRLSRRARPSSSAVCALTSGNSSSLSQTGAAPRSL